MPDVRFRPRIRRLLDEIVSDAASRVTEINIAKIAEQTGVSRQSVRNWIVADTDDPEAWYHRYDPEIERKLRLFFSDVLGREVQVVDRIELEDGDEAGKNEGPRIQEAMAAAAA